MKEILDFLDIPMNDRKRLQRFGDYLRFTLERIQDHSRTQKSQTTGSIDQNELL
jgi:hypothetical protein